MNDRLIRPLFTQPGCYEISSEWLPMAFLALSRRPSLLARLKAWLRA